MEKLPVKQLKLTIRRYAFARRLNRTLLCAVVPCGCAKMEMAYLEMFGRWARRRKIHFKESALRNRSEVFRFLNDMTAANGDLTQTSLWAACSKLTAMGS